MLTWLCFVVHCLEVVFFYDWRMKLLRILSWNFLVAQVFESQLLLDGLVGPLAN